MKERQDGTPGGPHQHPERRLLSWRLRSSARSSGMKGAVCGACTAPAAPPVCVCGPVAVSLFSQTPYLREVRRATALQPFGSPRLSAAAAPERLRGRGSHHKMASGEQDTPRACAAGGGSSRAPDTASRTLTAGRSGRQGPAGGCGGG